MADGAAVIENGPQKRSAPTTARARAETVRQLSWHSRLLNPNVINHLPLRDVQAKAEFVVQFHGFGSFAALIQTVISSPR